MAEDNIKQGTSKTVNVCSKLPHGLVLRLFKMVEFDEPVMGGGTRIGKRAEQVGNVVTLNGYAAPAGKDPRALVLGGRHGYAVTPGVDREFFAEWLRQNKDHPAVVNKLVFAADDDKYAKDKARELSGLRNGLEPIDPDKPPQVAKGVKIERADRKEA